MDYILHLDTATDNAIVALGGNGKLLASRNNTEARNHASMLNLLIEEVVAEAGIALNEISAVSICSGPGSYTGLRIGMSTAKGLCYALDKPLIAKDRLYLMSLPHTANSEYDICTCIIPARAGEYFLASYTSDKLCLVSPRHILEAELGNYLDEVVKRAIIVLDERTSSDIIIKKENIDIALFKSININSWLLDSYMSLKCHEFADLAHAQPMYLKEVYTHK